VVVDNVLSKIPRPKYIMGISNGPKEKVTASVTATGAQYPVSIFLKLDTRV
jgi:hypothetical protein